MNSDFEVGEVVVIPWGLDEVLGTVAEIYGNRPRLQVVIELSPELSSYVVDERTTITLPLSAVQRRVGAA